MAKPVEVVQEVVAAAAPVEAVVVEQATTVARSVGRTVTKKATLHISEICDRLGIEVKAEFLRSKGLLTAGDFWFLESNFNAICDAISAHVLACKRGA